MPFYPEQKSKNKNTELHTRTVSVVHVTALPHSTERQGKQTPRLHSFPSVRRLPAA